MFVRNSYVFHENFGNIVVALLRTGRGSGDGGCGPPVRGVLRGRHDRPGAGGQHGHTQAIPFIAANLE